mmetsp:Transcript_102430/g.293251  ORF Transcript_102430/g.293251 Transcript_102430/m.293251 type:complete len:260 (+) Transcript_102430:5051-5830(+)
MTLGKVRCLGSAQHLRAKFGNGYHLTLTIEPIATAILRDAVLDNLHEFVQAAYDNSATLINRHSRMLTYAIPAEKIDIGKAFSMFEDNMPRLQLSNYVISQPTLEQVFLGFTSEGEETSKVDHKTNEAEAAIDAAFDDTDVRLALKSKATCCGRSRKEHCRAMGFSCVMTPIMCVVWLFGFYGLAETLSYLVGDEVYYYMPKTELQQKSSCPGSYDIDTLGVYNYSALQESNDAYEYAEGGCVTLEIRRPSSVLRYPCI